MKTRLLHWLIAGLILSLALGCSRATGPTTPDESPGDLTALADASPADSSTGTRYLWGYWSLVIDPEAQTIEAVPLRSNSLHVNVVKFLEEGLLFISFANLTYGTDTVDLDVQLQHPFPGLNQYTGFDVRGIFITPGSVTGYSDYGIILAGEDETHLMNPDGWARWWNPSEFPVGMDIFSYRDGKLGHPYDGSNLNATLNAYKYFCNDLGPNDGLEELDPPHRGLFTPGYVNQRHYSIYFDPLQPLVYNYAVDANWDVPDPYPPSAVPGDFPPEANAPEAYRVEPEIVEYDLFFVDSVNKGGHAVIDVDVYDWWGCDYTEVNLEAPGVWNITPTSPSGGTLLYSTYQFDLDGSLLNSADTLTALITAKSLDAEYGLGDLAAENVATYMLLSVPVSDSPESPTVTSIDPDNEYIGETLTDVTVEGTNFASDAEVLLIKHDTPSIIIEATNEVVTGAVSISCDLDLSGPTVEPGKYDVRVRNPGTGLYGELIEGFTIDDTAHPWPRWRGGDLSQGSSQYVGYGDSSAATAPKWTFSAINQGQAGCSVANDGTIYFPVRNCALYAVNPDGTEKWMFQPLTPWISICPAIDIEGYVYTCMGSPSVNYLYKVDPETGNQVWSCYLSGTPCYATAPVVGHDGAIYVIYSTAYSSGYIQRVEPNGTLGWSYWIPSSAYSYGWQLGASVLPNGNIIATGGTHGRILCFEPNGGGIPLWTYQHTSWILHTPAVGPEGNVYFTTWSGGDLVAIDSDGDFLWYYDTGFYLWASPAVDPDTGHIFFGDRLGHFRCFDAEGNVLWDHIFSGTGIDGSAAVDANGDVYVAIGHQPSAPFVGVVKMDGTNGDILWQSDDIGYLVTHSPSIGADGTIYMTGHSASDALYAWGE